MAKTRLVAFRPTIALSYDPWLNLSNNRSRMYSPHSMPASALLRASRGTEPVVDCLVILGRNPGQGLHIVAVVTEAGTQSICRQVKAAEALMVDFHQQKRVIRT